MISVEMARKLKDAGLKHEWQLLDLFDDMTDEDKGEPRFGVITRPSYDPMEYAVWIPRLNQLLMEIEARGYKVWLRSKKNAWVMRVRGSGQGWQKSKYGDSPEEAAAQALLWILEQKAGDSMG